MGDGMGVVEKKWRRYAAYRSGREEKLAFCAGFGIYSSLIVPASRS